MQHSPSNSDVFKIGNVKCIALDDVVCDALQTLTDAGFAPSFKAVVAKSIDQSLARLKQRQSDSQTLNSDAPVLDLKLSRRQKELLPLLNAGLSNREVAVQLGVSEHTVKVHLWRFFRKTKATSRTKLLYVARLNGWV